MATDPSAIVIPFGKHRGATVAELLAKDPDYVRWLLAQGWLAQRFAELHAAILTRGAAPDDTPEHNAIQGRFLDPDFRLAVIHCVCSEEELSQQRDRVQNEIDERIRYSQEGSPRRAELEQMLPLSLGTEVQFELGGIDVSIRCDFVPITKYSGSLARYIEIKPSLGDDYPSVMRQMQRLGATVLVIETYTGTALSLHTVRQMFIANGMRVVTLAEIETEISRPP